MTEFRHLTDEQWFRLLMGSLKGNVVEGIEFPSFPPEELQAQFVGSSNESAIQEGFSFYKLVKEHYGKAEISNSNFLDFGCGWGRYLRFFRKDFVPQNMYGVDVDPKILEVCKQCGVPGQLETIAPLGQLPYPDEHFDLMIAYSVFTHLPEHIHQHWVQELFRVAKPGCLFVLTLEPLRFLDFVKGLADVAPESDWHRSMARFSSQVTSLKKDFQDGKFIYIPTGGGDYRSADVYGEAVVPLEYIKENWTGKFNVVEYVDDPDRFWQAVLVVQKSSE